MPYQKVTMIDDLPDLEQINPISQAQPMVSKPPRGIRTTDKMGSVPQESGMSYYQQPTPDVYETQDPYYDGGNNRQFDENLDSNYRPKTRSDARNNNDQLYEPYEREPREPTKPCDCNCKYIYDHIKDCEICKRFYKPDVTPYLILILIIACAMMAKKLFNF